MPKHFRIYFIAAFLCLSASASWAKERLAENGPRCTIQSIVLKSFPQADLILVKADGPIDRWHNFVLESPKRIVVDLYGCDYQGQLRPEIRTGRFIRLLRFGRHPDKIRIAANLGEGMEIQRHIRKCDHTLTMVIGRPEISFVEDICTPRSILASQAAISPKIEELPPAAPVAKEVEGTVITLPERANAEITVAEQDQPIRSAVQETEFGMEPPGGDAEEPWAEAPWEEEEFERSSFFELQGKLWNKYAHDTEEETRFEDDASNHAEVQLEAKYVPNERVHAVLSVDADYFSYRNSSDWDHDDDISLYNAYVSLSGKNFNLKVGNQMVKWGKTDEISPLDIINPEDFRDGFVRPREERKMPIPMVNVELFKGLYKLQGLFIPFFEKSELDIHGRDWAFFDHFEQEIGTFEVKKEDYPKTFSNSEAGIRFSGTVANLDYALSYSYTRDDLPSLGSLTVPPGFPLSFTSATLKDLAEFARTTNQPIILNYERQSITGFEFETTWGDFGLRGDVAYIHQRTFMTNELQSIRKPVFEYVLGADYNGPGSFYCNLQFSQAIVLNYDDGILFSDEITNMVNGEITKGVLDDNLELGFRYYYSITGEDYYYNPSILLKYWQNVTLEFGAEIVGGPDDTILGLFQDNDQVYGILEIRF